MGQQRTQQAGRYAGISISPGRQARLVNFVHPDNAGGHSFQFLQHGAGTGFRLADERPEQPPQIHPHEGKIENGCHRLGAYRLTRIMHNEPGFDAKIVERLGHLDVKAMLNPGVLDSDNLQ